MDVTTKVFHVRLGSGKADVDELERIWQMSSQMGLDR